MIVNRLYVVKKPHKSDIHTLTKYNIKKILFISLVILFLPASQPLLAIELEYFIDPEVTVRFEPPLKGVAKDVLDMYPRVGSDLKKTLGWEMPFKPTVFLIQDNDYFQKMTQNKFIVAFAAPAENLKIGRAHV